MTSNDGKGAAASAAAPSLAKLAAQIRAEISAVEEGHTTALVHAIRAGELLAQAKGQVLHGEWQPWLKENFPGDFTTAQNYIRFAANAERVLHLGSVREALAALRAEKKPRKLKPPKHGESTIKGKPGLSHDPEVVEWVRKKIRAGWDRNRIVATSASGDSGWPRPGMKLTNGGVSECRAAIAALEQRQPKQKLEAGGRLHDLYAKRRKAGDELDSGLWQARIDIIKMVGYLESVDFVSNGLRDADQDTVADLHENLGYLASWLDRSLEVVSGYMDEQHKRATIRKLREGTKGRTPEEIATARRLADNLERKLERMLTA